ncbi:hypothetical protein DL770_009085 [Monosporascus sp. CRB-9-2]|nr:hypothetical protein DL770_009085 [Monosporascus sp. CRB-9-2]
MAQKTLRLPNASFNDEDTVYYMSAKHRGDMYHMRAAMQLPDGNFSLVLYETDWVNPKRATQDTEDYLARSTRRNERTTFFVPWKNEKVLGVKDLDDTDLNNCYVNGVKLELDAGQYRLMNVRVIGEGDSTERIRDADKTTQVLEKIREGMFLLQPTTKTYLNGQLENVFEVKWGVQLDKTKTTILAMYRDTGQNPGGAYPEFDTGNGIDVIRTIAGKVLHDGEPQIRVLSSGTEDGNQKPGIGFYWDAIPKVDAVKANGDKKDEDVTKRDIEAYFLYWASQVKPYYQMALGLRSGAMDLFTFMGIPTMSIGLRNMAGEDRHEMLAGKVFKRVNVQYDVPRHAATAYVAHKDANKFPDRKLDPMIYCPYWDQKAPGDRSTGSGANLVTNREPDLKKRMDKENSRKNKKRDEIDKIKAEMNTLRKKKLANFSVFDSYVLEVGLKVAWQKYAGGPTLVFSTKGDFPDVITTHVARFCYREDEATDPKNNMLSRKDGDLLPINVMQSELSVAEKTLRLTTDLFIKFYRKPFDDDWKEIEGS